MENQERILSLIQLKAWKPVLDILHKNKNEILTDSLLTYSFSVFENEFFSYLIKGNKTITFDNLQDLFILHRSEYITLKKLNYKYLVCELARQSTGESSYNYAILFPEEKACREIIKNFEKKTKNSSRKKINKKNWIEIFNRLFEVINVQEDPRTYFSGSRFIRTLKEIDQYFPDYNQYIKLRNGQGKSTSRKIFYYDILMDLEESIRIDFVNRILEMVEPFEREKSSPIRNLIKGGKNQISKSQKKTTKEDIRTIFISYSWDSEEHQKWVLDLANMLFKSGVDVILDKYELKPGKSIPYFVETAIKKADKILMLFTPNYKLKAEKRAGGVGYEYSIMNSELYKDQTNNERIIPVLRNGESIDSIPEFMQQYIHIDMRNDDNFENSFKDLLREILDEPEFVKPKIGSNKI